MEEIEIIVDKNGDVKVEGKGIVGPDCESLTKEIEQALGDVSSRQKKAEYHRVPAVKRKAGA